MDCVAALSAFHLPAWMAAFVDISHQAVLKR